MPFAAFGLKKYLSGTSPVSIASNNIDSLARLGDSEVPAVKHAPSDTIPELGQRSQDDFKVFSPVAREETWNVLDEENSGQSSLKKSRKLKKESRLFPFKSSSRAHSRQRDVLAREPSRPDI
jgi:hypothetical protein